MTTLSRRSRMTSSSNSPQPRTDWSISTWPMGDAASPRSTMRSYSCAVRAIPPPRPPRVNAGRPGRPPLGDALVPLGGGGDPPAAPAERERGAHDGGQPDVVQRAERLRERGGDRAARHLQSGALHGLAEEVAVLGAGDRVVVRADELHPEALEGPVLVQR